MKRSFVRALAWAWGVLALTPVALSQAIAPIPFYDGFEGEKLMPFWMVETVGAGQAEIRTTDGPHHGAGHLILSSTADQTAGEVVVAIALDLQGASGLELGFSQREWDDEDNAMDGVWVSDDGVSWHLIFALTGAASTNQYVDHVLDLDAAVAGAGLAYTTPFYVSLQWRDNFDLPLDGFGFDDFWVRPKTSQTWRVPADFATIQGAIDAASDTDVVLVDPGTYTQRVDFKGKALSVIGLEGAGQTAIVTAADYSGPFPEAPAVRFVSGEGPGSQLVGFTVTATEAFDPTTYCVWANGATPWLQNCVLRDSPFGGHFGGGTLMQVDVLSNGTTSGGGGFGLGGGVSGAATLVDCRIQGNIGLDGGGLRGKHTLIDCDVIGNHALFSYGGGWNALDSGGVAFASRFQGNFTSDRHSAGGVFGPASLFDTLLEANDADGNFNICGVGGGGYLVAHVRNCTVMNNTAACPFSGGAGFNSSGPVSNSIVWGNQDFLAPANMQQLYNVEATYSNVEGSWPGTGNVDVDPLLDADFFPLAASPMIDAGDPSHPFDGDGTRIDMGARPLAQQDCDGNGVPDPYELVLGAGEDCNGNGFLDSCDLAFGLDTDLDGNGVLDSCVPAPLMADVYELSVSAGGTQSFALTTSLPNQAYVLLGSGNGTTPGITAAGLNLPLNPGPYLDFTLSHFNAPPLAGSFGLLAPDGAGQGVATASFTLPANFDPALVGQTAHHAFVTIDPFTGAFTSTSNPAPVTFVP